MAENNIPQRESFTFYKSFEDGICQLSDTEQLQVYRAISRYSLFGERPVLNGYAGMAWAFIEPILRKSRIAFENGLKGGDFGHLGGTTREKMLGNQNARKHKTNPQTNPQTNPKRAWISDTEADTYTETNRESKKSVTRFTPPTIEEVKAYIVERGYSVNADAFFNHYEAIGWKVGRNVMKDWRASVRSWQSREQLATPQQSTSTHNPASKWIE